MKAFQFFSKSVLIGVVLLIATTAWSDLPDPQDIHVPFEAELMGQKGPEPSDRFSNPRYGPVSDKNTDDSLNTTLMGYFDTDGFAADIFVSGNYAYVADNFEGLRIIDVSDPGMPVETGYFDTDGYAPDVFVSGNYAYVADGYSEEGLRIIDVSNPASPFEAGFFESGGMGSVIGVFVSGNYAYVADNFEGLHVINVSNPEAPSGAGGFFTGGTLSAVFVSGNYAYLADSSLGLIILDVNPPGGGLVEIGYFDTGGYTRDVFVSGNYAYVANGDAGLRIINVSNPGDPFEVGYFDTGGSSRSVFVSDNYAYVADGSSGLRIIEVSNPAAPFEAGYFDTDGSSNGIFVIDNLAYIADGSSGLKIIRNDLIDVVPAFLSFFDLRANKATVTAHWKVAHGSNPDDFRLAGSNGEAQWNVPNIENHYSEFTAEDRSSYLNTPGQISYSLFMKSIDDQWNLLAEDAVMMEAPRLETLLFPAFPNPFNPQTTISFDIPKETTVHLRVLDASGRLVRVLLDGEIVAEGRREAVWNGRDDSGRQVATGVYFYRLETEDYSETKRMALIK